MLVGYARVSTLEQDPSLQVDALEKAGCDKIFDDKASGAGTERPGLQAALDYVRQGDTLLVWRLDRLGRSLKHLIEIVTSLEDWTLSIFILTPHIGIHYDIVPPYLGRHVAETA